MSVGFTYMALIDELQVNITAGRGGDGVVRWRHEKSREFGGPSGGDGGRGGDVYVEGNRDLAILAQYRNKKEFVAENGESGKGGSKHGKDGEDYIISVPVGSIVTNLETREVIRIDGEGQKNLILKGGAGGIGNEAFKSSTNVNPFKATKGKLGQLADFLFELELVADAGLIGLPNAGKSSLLNELTNAHSEVGSYAFTTLEPHLGALHKYVLADIPGLIEGAALGKGLGDKFLRHIKRTKALIHCVSLEEEDVVKTYDVVRKELFDYQPDLCDKQEIIVLTKSDVVSEEELEEKKKLMLKKSQHLFTVSILDEESLKNFKDSLIKLLRAM